ncbi:MAG: hypothetical protein KAJ19_27560, partial [Gammaproteobacteria bacterium]|nr:hypothetical protein [Gammaproteobacteria bacterium]
YNSIRNLVDVPTKFQLAIEAACTPYFDAIIVDETSTIEKCLTYVRESDLGQVHFISLAQITDNQIKLPTKKAKVIDFALNLIDPVSPFFKAFHFILSDTAIVADLNTAIRVASQYDRVVTLNGDLVIQNTIFKSGSPQSIQAMIDAEQEQLDWSSKKLEDLIIQQEELTKTIDETEIRSTATKKNLDEYQIRSNTLSHDLEAVNKQINLLTQQKTDADQELSSLKEKKEELGELVTQQQDQISKLREELDVVTEERNKITHLSHSEQHDEISSEIQQITDKLSSLITKIETKTVKIESGENVIGSITADKNAATQDRENYIEKQKELKASILQIERSMKQYTKEAVALIAQGNTLRSTLNQLEQNKQNQKRDIGKIERANTSIRKEIEEYTIRITRQETEIKNYDLRLSEFHEQRREFATIRVPKSIRENTTAELDEKLALLVIQIDDLLPINQKAIHAYKEEVGKYQQLKSKYELVEKEKKSIEDFMAEVDREKKKIFLDAFNQINANFQNIFGILSPGGRAELILEKPEEPFLGGVEIRSQPAGKTLLSTRMMSGGEKALTALAFILAIQ